MSVKDIMEIVAYVQVSVLVIFVNLSSIGERE